MTRCAASIRQVTRDGARRHAAAGSRRAASPVLLCGMLRAAQSRAPTTARPSTRSFRELAAGPRRRLLSVLSRRRRRRARASTSPTACIRRRPGVGVIVERILPKVEGLIARMRNAEAGRNWLGAARARPHILHGPIVAGRCSSCPGCSPPSKSPPRSAQSLSMLRGGLPGARWIDPENYHLTLRFIGDIDDVMAREIAYMLGDVRRTDVRVCGSTACRPSAAASRARWWRRVAAAPRSDRAAGRARTPDAADRPRRRRGANTPRMSRWRGCASSSSRDVADYLSVRGRFARRRSACRASCSSRRAPRSAAAPMWSKRTIRSPRWRREAWGAGSGCAIIVPIFPPTPISSLTVALPPPEVLRKPPTDRRRSRACASSSAWAKPWPSAMNSRSRDSGVGTRVLHLADDAAEIELQLGVELVRELLHALVLRQTAHVQKVNAAVARDDRVRSSNAEPTPWLCHGFSMLNAASASPARTGAARRRRAGRRRRKSRGRPCRRRAVAT